MGTASEGLFKRRRERGMAGNEGGIQVCRQHRAACWGPWRGNRGASQV